MKRFCFFLTHPCNLLIGILEKVGWWIPDRMYLRIYYLLHNKQWLHLNPPRTFNEKIQWLKLYDRKPLYTNLVDKSTVKRYVADVIGEEYIIPTLGVWDNIEDIPFVGLPSKFVLKTTHDGGGGGVFICDKSNLDIEKIKRKIYKSFSHNIYETLREWPYKDVKPRIMAEEFLDQKKGSGKELIDYKFFCFNGMPRFCQVKTHEDERDCTDLFDMQWQLLPFNGINPTQTNASKAPLKPQNYDEMISLAKELSKVASFCRVDFYNIEGKVYFGELTFYPASGMGCFTPAEYDNYVGEMLNLKCYGYEQT